MKKIAFKLYTVGMLTAVMLSSAGNTFAEPTEADSLDQVLLEYGVTVDTSTKATIEEKDKRLYKNIPWEIKCSKNDFRTFHGCLEARFFDPSARVYFDTGTDDADEIDIFNNGGLNVSLDFVSVHLPWRFGRSEYFDSWSWGPMIGVGIGSPAQDSEDGSKEASSAPVVLASYGLLIEYKINQENGASFGFEIGRATGFSSDESFGDNDDTATYVGLKINIPTTQRKKD